MWLQIRYASHEILITRIATEETVRSRTVPTIAVVTTMGPGVRKAGW